MTSKAPKKSVYRVRNWKEYEAALVRRGSLTLWVEEATLRAWRYQGPTRRGAQFAYSDLAIECLLTLRAVYHLTLRATEGLARSLFQVMQLDLSVPDHTTLSRRAATVRITLPKRVTPPRRDAKIQRHGNSSGPRLARDENLRRIRQIGRRAWKQESGYHQRSLAETAMFRMKTLFGPGVSSRNDGQRATEAGIRCRTMNIMTHQGMPQSERVAA
jgi:Transposase DDE domain